MDRESFVEIATAQPIDLEKLLAPLLEYLSLAENPCYRGHVFSWISGSSYPSSEPPIGHPCLCGGTRYGMDREPLESV